MNKITIAAGKQRNSIDVNRGSSTANVDITKDLSAYYSKVAEDWATRTDGLVDNKDYSAKYYANQSKSSAEISKIASEDAKGYSENAETQYNLVVEKVDGLDAKTEQSKQEIVEVAEQEKADIKSTGAQEKNEIVLKGAEIIENAEQEIDNKIEAVDSKIGTIDDKIKNLSLPIGAIIPANTSNDYTPVGCLACDGTEYNKEQFSDLWDNYLTGRTVINWGEPVNLGARRWYDITYGNGIFVAVGSDGNGGSAITSTDGVNWTSPVNTPSYAWNYWTSVAFGNGIFVAVGSNSYVTTSIDGVTWTTSSVGSSHKWNDIAYGNGKFVAISDSGYITTTVDGKTWSEPVKLESTHNGVECIYTKITYGNDIFMVAGDVTDVFEEVFAATSTDGITWTNLPYSVGVPKIAGLTYGNGMFLIVSYWGSSVYSKNGIYWETPPNYMNKDEGWKGVTYGNGFFVAVGENGYIVTSTDGENWGTAEQIGMDDWQDIVYGNGKFVAVSAYEEKEGLIITDSRGYTVKAEIENLTLLKTCTYSEYEQDLTTYGQCAKFAVDVVNGTFRVPFVKAPKRYLIDKKDATDTDASWYAIYSDGLCEQGQYLTTTGTSATVTYLIEYKGRPFVTAHECQIDTDTDTEGYTNVVGVSSITNTSFRISCVKGRTYYWEAKGYIDLQAPTELNYFVVVANGQTNQSMMDWSAWASSLQGKANVDGSNWDNSVKNVDGQWVAKELKLSEATAIGDYSFNLKEIDYLPNDNYQYEVLFCIRSTYSGSSVDMRHIYFGTDIITSNETPLAHSINTNSRMASSSVALPLNKFFQFSIDLSFSSNAVFALGYRRLGTNG